MKLKNILVLGLAAFSFSCASAPQPVEKSNSRQVAPAETAAGEESSEDEALDAAPTAATYSSQPKTRYQVMSEGYDQATLMPVLSDFDLLDEPSPRVTCYSSKAADPNLVKDFVIKQMLVQIPGVADYGPLFPGSADHVENRLVIGRNNGWVNGQNLTNEIRRVFELAKAPGSLVVKINENKFGIYQDIGAPAEVWIRKNSRNQLFFKVYKVDAEHKRNEVFIGYCYRKAAPPMIPGNP